MPSETKPYRQPAFSSGELSPRVLGRTDVAQYRTGAAQMENWLPVPTGPGTRRPGMKYIGTCKTVTFPQATEQASSTGAFDLNAVCFAPELGLNGRWVAVGDDAGADSMIVTCDADVNGRPSTWTAVAGGSIPDDEQLNAIAWSGSLFAAVGNSDGAAGTIYTSPDGLVWTKRTSSAGNNNLFAVCWTGPDTAPPAQFVAVGAAGTVIYSSDGITWAAGSGLSGASAYRTITQYLNTLVTVNVSATGTVYYSTDSGVTWAAGGTLPSAHETYASIWWNGYYYFLGDNGARARVARIAAPTDSTTSSVFTTTTNPSRLLSVQILGTRLVSVGTGGIFVSNSDGTTWTETAVETVALNGLAVSSSYAVIVGDDDATDAQLFTIPLDTSKRRIEPFVGSTGTPYAMEFGHLYIRFYRDEARMDSTPGTAYEVATPWDANDISVLQLAQANDVVYITHPNYPPYRLTRTSETTFALVSLMDTSSITTNINTSTYRLWDGPYMDENSTVSTMTLNATGTGAKVLTLSAASAINGGAGFLDSDIGRAFRIFSAVDGSKVWGWGIITDANTTVEADVYMVEDPSTTSAETRWALGSWSATTGYPKTVSFFQQRLAFGFTRSQPQTLWMSITASFQEFDPTQVDDTVVDDNGIFITLATEEASHIRWIKSMRQMNIGTSGGVYQLAGDRNTNAVTPSVLSVDLASQWKAQDGAVPDNIGDTLFYVQQSGRIVRGVAPGAAGNAESQPNMNLLADHVTATGVLQLTYAAVPFSVLWGRRTDGLLIGITVNPEERTLGWHRHILGGTLSGADWPAAISLAVLPVADQDQLYAIVRRTINSAQVETIEAMQAPYDSNEMAQEDCCYVDSGLKYDGVSTSSITGLSHLEGQAVIAWADGLPQGPFTVASGAITLTTAASVVWVGLDYSSISDLVTMPLKADGNDAMLVRAVSTLLELLDTVDMKIGQDPTDTAKFKSIQGVNPALVTAGTTDVRMVHNSNAATRYQLTIRPVGAAPVTITGMTHMIEFSQP